MYNGPMLNLCNRTRFLRLADDRDRLRSVIGLKLGLKTNFNVFDEIYRRQERYNTVM